MVDGEFIRITRSSGRSERFSVAAKPGIEFVVGIDVAVHVQAEKLDLGSTEIDGFAGIVEANASIAKRGRYAAPFLRSIGTRSALVPPTQMNATMVVKGAFCENVNGAARQLPLRIHVGNEFVGGTRACAERISARTAATATAAARTGSVSASSGTRRRTRRAFRTARRRGRTPRTSLANRCGGAFGATTHKARNNQEENAQVPHWASLKEAIGNCKTWLRTRFG